jgi:rare lipoprotein A
MAKFTLVTSFLTLATTCFLSTSALAETCIASVYNEGTRTASGERLNPRAMTAAHKTRRLGSMVMVTAHASGRSIKVRINDRGPYIAGRCIDLTTGAGRLIGLGSLGRVTVLSLDEAPPLRCVHRAKFRARSRYSHWRHIGHTA